MSEERCDSDSMPSRRDSREREMLDSEVGFGSRLREMALERSRRESLMWSQSRRSWCWFDILGSVLGMFGGWLKKVRYTWYAGLR